MLFSCENRKECIINTSVQHSQKVGINFSGRYKVKFIVSVFHNPISFRCIAGSYHLLMRNAIPL